MAKKTMIGLPDYQKKYPPNFTPTGDMTNQMLEKLMNEQTEQYKVINDLKDSKVDLIEFDTEIVKNIPGGYFTEGEWGNSNNGRTKLLSPAKVAINIGGSGFLLPSAIELDCNNPDHWDTLTPVDYSQATNRAGITFYVYAVKPVSGTVQRYKLSANPTAPSGYDISNSKQEVEFSCLANDYGVVAGDNMSGHLKGDVDITSVGNKQSRIVSQISSQLANIITLLADIITLAPTGIDDTSNIQSLLDAKKIPKLRPGVYYVTGLKLNDNAKILSSGYATVLQQKSGVAAGTRIISIQGDNVFVSEMTYKGNITTDIGEQNHAVFIQNLDKANRDIIIEGISASDIRGDALCISSDKGHDPQNIKVGNIYAKNCYRNGISITSGQNIEIGNVIALQCGLYGIDIESDTAGGNIYNLNIANVLSANINVVGTVSNPTHNVEFGNVTLLRNNGGSTPNYIYNGLDALAIRNSNNIKFGHVKISGFDRFAIYPVSNHSDLYIDDIYLKSLNVDNCSLTDTVYNSYVSVSAFKNIHIGYVNATLQKGKILFLGTDGIYDGAAQVTVDNGICIGSYLAAYCRLIAKELEVSGGSNWVCYNLKPTSVLQNCKLDNTNLLGSCEGTTMINCQYTYTGQKFNTGHENVAEINCKDMTNNIGQSITYGSALPTSGSYMKNDYRVNTNQSELGTVGSKYIVKGWIRMTTGSTHNLNTDWFEDRALTGN